MSAHTPGPWVARKDPQGGPQDCCIGLPGDVVPIDYVAVCNRRDGALISAAPDLLHLAKLVHGSFGGGLTMTFTEADVQAFRAAIEKAEGQP